MVQRYLLLLAALCQAALCMIDNDVELSCGFESTCVGWRNGSNGIEDQTDWARANDGVFLDPWHSIPRPYQGSAFAYVLGGDVALPQFAWLVSDTIPCLLVPGYLTFQYWKNTFLSGLFRQPMPRLQIFLRKPPTTQNLELLGDFQASNAWGWRFAAFEIPASQQEFQIVIQAEYQATFDVIGIDDIQFRGVINEAYCGLSDDERTALLLSAGLTGAPKPAFVPQQQPATSAALPFVTQQQQAANSLLSQQSNPQLNSQLSQLSSNAINQLLFNQALANSNNFDPNNNNNFDPNNNNNFDPNNNNNFNNFNNNNNFDNNNNNFNNQPVLSSFTAARQPQQRFAGDGGVTAPLATFQQRPPRPQPQQPPPSSLTLQTPSFGSTLPHGQSRAPVASSSEDSHPHRIHHLSSSSREQQQQQPRLTDEQFERLLPILREKLQSSSTLARLLQLDLLGSSRSGSDPAGPTTDGGGGEFGTGWSAPDGGGESGWTGSEPELNGWQPPLPTVPNLLPSPPLPTVPPFRQQTTSAPPQQPTISQNFDETDGNTTAVCPAVNCGFEDNPCAYEGTDDQLGAWVIVQGRIGNPITGINRAAFGRFYSVAYTNSGVSTQVLRSAPFTTREQSWLSFWYYFANADDARLVVCDQRLDNCFWEKTKQSVTPDSRKWRRGSVLLPPGKHQVMFVVEQLGDNYYVGIDQIFLRAQQPDGPLLRCDIDPL